MHSDTSTEIELKQQEVFSETSGAQRVAMALDMSDEAKQITCDGIRARHPDFDQDMIHAEWLNILYGPELTKKILNHVL